MDAIDPQTPVDALPQFLSVAQIQSYLGIGRSAAYDFARQHGIRIGSKTVSPVTRRMGRGVPQSGDPRSQVVSAP